ncbi:MAG: hypothetical protein ACM30D_09990 [Hyphomicrobiales bacterium]
MAGVHIRGKQWRKRAEDLRFVCFAREKGVRSPGVDRSDETDFGIDRSDRREQLFDTADTPKSDSDRQPTLELSGQRSGDEIALAHHVGLKVGLEHAQRSVGDGAAAREQKEDLKDEQAALESLEQHHR